MAKIVLRHTLSKTENSLWLRDDMKGWCKAMEGCVEDDARENGFKKYVIYDLDGEVLVKGAVTPLPDNRPMEARRETALY
jgi:hypothetical protein